MILVKIINDGSGSEDVGHYSYGIFINGELIESGYLHNFLRRLGYKALIRKLARVISTTKE